MWRTMWTEWITVVLKGQTEWLKFDIDTFLADLELGGRYGTSRNNGKTMAINPEDKTYRSNLLSIDHLAFRKIGVLIDQKDKRTASSIINNCLIL